MVSVSSITCMWSLLFLSCWQKQTRICSKDLCKTFSPKKKRSLGCHSCHSQPHLRLCCLWRWWILSGRDSHLRSWEPVRNIALKHHFLSTCPSKKSNKPSVSRLEKARYPKNSDGTQNDRMVLHWIYLAQLMLKFSAESKKWCDQKEQELVKPRKSWSSWLMLFVLRLLRWCEGQRNMHDTHWYPRSWSSLMKRSNITLSNPILAADQFDTWWLQPSPTHPPTSAVWDSLVHACRERRASDDVTSSNSLSTRNLHAP